MGECTASPAGAGSEAPLSPIWACSRRLGSDEDGGHCVFQRGLAGQLQQVVPPAPVVCFIKSTVSVSELFRFLRLLQDGFSVVLYFQGGFVANGYHIAVAAF